MASASRHEDVPEMTQLQKRAIKAVEELADSAELRMDYVLQAGDIQLLHNHSIVHARTAFVDHDDVSTLAILHAKIDAQTVCLGCALCGCRQAYIDTIDTTSWKHLL